MLDYTVHASKCSCRGFLDLLNQMCSSELFLVIANPSSHIIRLSCETLLFVPLTDLESKAEPEQG